MVPTRGLIGFIEGQEMLCIFTSFWFNATRYYWAGDKEDIKISFRYINVHNPSLLLTLEVLCS